jgi:hypothetical protein
LFSPGTPVSSPNKIDRHDISEILIESAIKQHKPNQNVSDCDKCNLPIKEKFEVTKG